jgi:1-acyl-sn-glycerol-3-phosphate acyltransferase
MWLYKLNQTLIPLMQMYWRVSLTGAIDRVPKEGPLILAANHTSFLDPWFIGMVFPRRVRHLITPKWYYSSSLWRVFFDAFGVLPAEPGKPRQTVKRVCAALARGEVVGLFPEGRVSYDGRLQKVRSGIARIAAQSGAPVIPAGIIGAFESLPRQRRLPRPGKLTITLGEPIIFPSTARGNDLYDKERRLFRERLLRDLCRLSGQEGRFAELLRGSQPRSPGGASSSEVADSPVFSAWW